MDEEERSGRRSPRMKGSSGTAGEGCRRHSQDLQVELWTAERRGKADEQDQGGAGDEPAAVAEPDCDSFVGVPRNAAFLTNADHDEHLVRRSGVCGRG
jgi:hypothetical protein